MQIIPVELRGRKASEVFFSAPPSRPPSPRPWYPVAAPQSIFSLVLVLRDLLRQRPRRLFFFRRQNPFFLRAGRLFFFFFLKIPPSVFFSSLLDRVVWLIRAGCPALPCYDLFSQDTCFFPPVHAFWDLKPAFFSTVQRVFFRVLAPPPFVPLGRVLCSIP